MKEESKREDDFVDFIENIYRFIYISNKDFD